MENGLGKLIKELREGQGLTQEDLATRIDASQQSVAKWESGKSVPRLSSLTMLAIVLKIDKQMLLNARNQDQHPDARAAIGGHSSASASEGERTAQTGSSHASIGGAGHRMPTGTNMGGIAGGRIGANHLISAQATYAHDFEDKVRALLAQKGKLVAWGKVIRGPGVTWRPDLMTEELVVEIKTTTSAPQLSAALRGSIPRMLWNMATLRAYENDSRVYALILSMPRNVGPDADGTDEVILRNNAILLTRMITEAAILNIQILPVYSPEDAVEALGIVAEGESQVLGRYDDLSDY